MSTHNTGFYEDLTKIIFELSSNIIKYAPYFFCCINQTAQLPRGLNFEYRHLRDINIYVLRQRKTNLDQPELLV